MVLKRSSGLCNQKHLWYLCSVRKSQSIFLLYIMAVVLFSSMQLRLCPEIPVFRNGHVIHGLCAIRDKSTKPTFWPPMGCKNISTHYDVLQDHSTAIVKATGTCLLPTSFFSYSAFGLSIAKACFINYLPPQNFDPPSVANALRGPPAIV
jgi:hypothetical protein